MNEENFPLSDKTEPDAHLAALSELSRQRDALRAELQSSRQAMEHLRVSFEAVNQEKLGLIKSLQAQASSLKVLEAALEKQKSSELQFSNRLAELQSSNEKLKRDNEAKDARHLGLVAESKSFITAKRDLDKHLEKHKVVLSKLAQAEAELKQIKREKKQDVQALAHATKQQALWEKQANVAIAELEALSEENKLAKSELKAANKSAEKMTQQLAKQQLLVDKLKLKATAATDNHKLQLAKVKSDLAAKLDKKDQVIRELKLRKSAKAGLKTPDKSKPTKKAKGAKQAGKTTTKSKASKKVAASGSRSKTTRKVAKKKR